MNSPHKRPNTNNTTESTSATKRAKLKSNEDHCAFCGYTKNETKDEGELQYFPALGKHVHSACLMFAGRTSKETSDETVERVVSGKGNYKCKYKRCEKPSARATIGCAVKRCQKVFHYRCALKNGMLLSRGFFFCTAHRKEADEIFDQIKKDIRWPGEVEYIHQNDWSGISEEDQKQIYFAVNAWDTYTDIMSPYVKIVKVKEGDWAWSETMPYDLRAKTDIPQGEVVCEIVGKVIKVDKNSLHSEQSTDFYFPAKEKGNIYVTKLSAEYTKRLAVDSSEAGNEGRYINFLNEDAIQNDLKSNAELNTVWSMGKLRILVIATAPIAENQSIILDDASDVRPDDAIHSNGRHTTTNTNTSTSASQDTDGHDVGSDDSPLYDFLQIPNSPNLSIPSIDSQTPAQHKFTPPKPHPPSRTGTTTRSATTTTIRPIDASPIPNENISIPPKPEITRESPPKRNQPKPPPLPLPSNLSRNFSKKSAAPHRPTPSTSTATTASTAAPLPNIPSSAATQSEPDAFPVADASISSSQSTPPSQPSLPLVGPIDADMQAICARYNIDFKSEIIDFPQLPLQFYYDLNKLESHCRNLLQQELLKNPVLFEQAKTSRQLKASLLVSYANLPALKHTFKPIEDQLAQLERDAASVLELEDRCLTVEKVHKRAKAELDALHSTFSSNQLPKNTNNNNASNNNNSQK